MDDAIPVDSEGSEFVEVDPTGRYGRYDEILGKGSSKIVYRAFDEYEGIEVAWNQVKLHDFLQSPEDLERLYSEIHLLKTLKHTNIMKFCTSWVDTANRNINFVTEMFTSGTLRQYRLKHKRINIRAIKHWCRQILQGLVYLHSHDPPVIHRDLKCDNIFINGNQGEVKIGDLGLASMLKKSHTGRCVGTPEFMAPEVFEEEYNELVDIYSFGMCILEMVTFEYPYSECTHPAQIYKRVVSGKKPEALYKVKDPEVRGFVEKCLARVSHRPSAWELLNHPFLEMDDFRTPSYRREYDAITPFLKQPLLIQHDDDYERELDLDTRSIEFDLFTSHEYECSENVDITIKGRRYEEGGLFFRLRMTDGEGRVRNIHFPFDIETDTALSVASEMVDELNITNQDVAKIAETIDNKVASLVPDWKPGCWSPSSPGPSDDSVAGWGRTSSSHHRPSMGPQDSECSDHACGSMHGRFEEIRYRVDGPQSGPIDQWNADNKREGLVENNKENVRLKEGFYRETMQKLRRLKAKYKMGPRGVTGGRQLANKECAETGSYLYREFVLATLGS